MFLLEQELGGRIPPQRPSLREAKEKKSNEGGENTRRAKLTMELNNNGKQRTNDRPDWQSQEPTLIALAYTGREREREREQVQADASVLKMDM